MKQWVQLNAHIFMLFKYFGMRLFFPTIPKPLKQYTLFKKRVSISLIFTCSISLKKITVSL
jgi:hypothetical protein